MTKNTLLNTKVSDLVRENPKYASLFERFGINYCCGGQVILQEACEKKGLNPDEVIQEIEEINASDAQPEKNWAKASMQELIQHILDTHHKYTIAEIPRIKQLSEKAAKSHGDIYPELLEIKDIVNRLCDDLSQHLKKEEEILFPALIELEKTKQTTKGKLDSPIAVMRNEHEEVGKLLEQLQEASHNYEPPKGVCNTQLVLYDSLKAFAHDAHQHISKENNFLFAKAQEYQGSA